MIADPFATMASTPAVQALCRRLEEGGVLSAAGISPGALPFLAVLLRRLFPQRPIVIVVPGLKAQEGFHQDVETWLELDAAAASNQGSESTSATEAPPAADRKALPPPLFYPAWEVLPHEAKLPHVDVISERLETLEALSGHFELRPPSSAIVIATVAALLQRTFPPEELRARTRRFQRGDQADPRALAEWLEAEGYEPEAQVSHKGELALRGGILDVFPPTAPWPVRLEFFGDELDSLRYFDPITQISRESLAEITLPPAGELGILKKWIGGEGGIANCSGAGPAAAVPWLATLIDHLPREAIFLLCEPERLAEQAAEYARAVPAQDPFFLPWEQFLEQAGAAGMTWLALAGESVNPATEEGAVAGGEPLAGEPSPAASPADGSEPDLAVGQGNRASVGIAESGAEEAQRAAAETKGIPEEREGTGDVAEPAANLSFASLDAFRPILERAPEPQVAEVQRREFFAQLHRWLRQGYGVHVFCNNDGERQRFAEIWEEYGLGSPKSKVRSPRSKVGKPERSSDFGLGTLDFGLWTHLGALTRGFLSEAGKLVVVTDAEIFGRYKVQRPRRLKSPHAQTSRSLLEIDFTDLEEGDYVVHVQHGIGRYVGLQVLPSTGGVKPLEKAAGQVEGGQECLVIEYASGDPAQPPPKLYVPVSEAHLVSKYVGAGKARPPLNTLGGGRWAKTREAAERAVRDLAGELLSIQAARESQAGTAFAPDTPWQREFESAFLYEETPDQMRAIVQTKADMERPKPMDRLICGDVGFGKTEVAIRAAFKSVLSGKQVAVLVPTTILAQQHYNTFRERMADYPVRVELLSRFRTPRAQKRILEDLAAGAVDIVIGTHRLIQNDVAFKDLGLVVIDEEQRFGVMHKEKFKLLRKLVDVLTLSATPIPRTLYLALTGARDMSTIETPPQDRLPVETIVAQYDERLVRDAIQRELNRQGQVFYLHNRVFDIESVHQRLLALLPKARIVVGHGQMPADELEAVMTRFVNGEADVLLSTTIIESGLDIPNANTIIIDRADRFGLSDLYQLRGRVGRYKHQAYAFLLLPRHAGLLTDARKRISAIKQYSMLGSGFKIAMRDLEIRGAGNLLGPQQSGHITAVGFELYCQLLKQSIGVLKGEPIKARLEVPVRLDFLALSPAEEAPAKIEKRRTQRAKAGLRIEVPREVATYVDLAEADETPEPSAPVERGAAFIPLGYISDSRQRIEIYRKLAEATDLGAIEALRTEMQDRFGPVPSPVELLLQAAGLKVVAGERGITSIETKDDKLMLTRNNDFITLGGKFPRLTKTSAKARLNEIRRLILALH